MQTDHALGQIRAEADREALALQAQRAVELARHRGAHRAGGDVAPAESGVQAGDFLADVVGR
ncbi:hypothetical protein D3C86_2218820 [compost metagenome]